MAQLSQKQRSLNRSSFCRARSRRAFTLVEVLVIVSIVAVIASLLVTGHARVKPAGQALQCLANTKQLMLANLMYQQDSGGDLPMTTLGGFAPPASGPSVPWASGWLNWEIGSDNTNAALLLHPRYASLGIYVGRTARTFKCPADVYVSQAQRDRGWTARVRSISANFYVGKREISGPPTDIAGVYITVQKARDLVIPGPSRTWVYADEHPDSIDDPGLFPPNLADTFPDAPATYHNGGAGFAFADGHSEIHRWRGTAMNKSRHEGGLLGVSFAVEGYFKTERGDPDIFWLSYGSPRHSDRTVADY